MFKTCCFLVIYKLTKRKHLSPFYEQKILLRWLWSKYCMQNQRITTHYLMEFWITNFGVGNINNCKPILNPYNKKKRYTVCKEFTTTVLPLSGLMGYTKLRVQIVEPFTRPPTQIESEGYTEKDLPEGSKEMYSSRIFIRKSCRLHFDDERGPGLSLQRTVVITT